MQSTSFDPSACQRLVNEKIAPLYGWAPGTHQNEDRLIFYLRLVHEAGALGPGRHLLDLGAGLSAFGCMARLKGMDVTVVDDFGGGGGVDRDDLTETRRMLEAWKTQWGIRVVEQDFIAKPLPLDSNSVDIVTCFHSLEHWHHSPKRLFREITRVLKPQGWIILATPNAANIRKRFYVLTGRNTTVLDDWYHHGDPVFRGHVREPVLGELHQILKWNGFDVVASYGRNFIGRGSHALAFLPPRLLEIAAAGSQSLLRFFPTLCSDIHVMGRKRA